MLEITVGHRTLFHQILKTSGQFYIMTAHNDWTSHQHNLLREWSVGKSCHYKFAKCLTKRKIWNDILVINTEKWLLPALSQELYGWTSIIQTSIIRISWLSGLFLWSQFGYKYLLVTIKICSHIPFKTTALKCAVKCEGILLSKRKRSPRACRN